MRNSVQLFYKAINRVTKQIFPDKICVATFYFVGAHLACGQTAQRGLQLIESRPVIFPHVLSDSRGFYAEGVNLLTEVIAQFYGVSTLNPRPKTAHEAPKIAYAIIPSSFFRMLSVSSIATDGEEMTKQGSHEAAPKKGYNRGENAVGCGLVWHFSLAVIGGLCGYAGYSAFRAWCTREEALNTIPKQPQHPPILHDIYCLMSWKV
jgi:hypothetical protein